MSFGSNVVVVKCRLGQMPFGSNVVWVKCHFGQLSFLGKIPFSHFPVFSKFFTFKMMRQLKFYDGYTVRIEHICNLKIGTFARFKPILSKRVLTIINDENIKKVRHVLEVQLSKYQCLSVGDEIAIEVGGIFFEF